MEALRTKLCPAPRVAVAVLHEMMLPHAQRALICEASARAGTIHRVCCRIARFDRSLTIERMRGRKTARHRKGLSPSVRSQALRFLEQCERGLVAAYESLPHGLLSARDSHRLAALHEGHATLLAECVEHDGGRPPAGPYDLWITEPTISGMRFSEQTSFTTYRDHLGTLAPATARVIRTRIMPDHYEAAEHLAEVAARHGRKWRHPIHSAPALGHAAAAAKNARPEPQRGSERATVRHVAVGRRRAQATPQRRRQAR